MEFSLPEKVASLALDTFAKLPAKCKPRTLPDGRREWTPISAVVLNRMVKKTAYDGPTTNNVKIVSLATGTKSLPVSALPKCNGLILHDCHAEILALRGFNQWLLGEIRTVLELESYESVWLQRMNTNGTAQGATKTDVAFPFELHGDVEISLFSSEGPCGDASLELLMAATEAKGGDVTPWPDHPAEQYNLPPGRGYFSRLGVLRRKPARVDAEISMSMSCTDKLMLKQFTGLLSFPADLLIKPDNATFLKRIVVYDDQYNERGYNRAFGELGRLNKVLNATELKNDIRPQFFDIDILPHGFRRFEFEKSNTYGDDDKSRPSNISAVWVAGTTNPSNVGGADVIEVLLNGVKQGFRQFDDRERKRSILCRKSLLTDTVKIRRLLKVKEYTGESDSELFDTASTYSELKSSPYRVQRTRLKQTVLVALGGWPNKPHQDDFDVSMPLLSID